MDNIRNLLRDCSLEAVSHKRSGADGLKSVKSFATAGSALEILAEAGVLSVPVADSENGAFSGVLSVTDCLRKVVKELKLENCTRECTLEEVTSAFDSMRSASVCDVMHPGDLWYVEGQNPSVFDAVKEMMAEKHVHHRLYTCSSITDTRPMGVLSQSDVTQMMWDHRVELGAILQKSVKDLGLCAAAAETVPASHTTMQVFVDMYRDHKTCMGVLAASGGALVGNISISDLRSVTPALYPKLLAPVGEFILALRGLPAPSGDVDWKDALSAVKVHAVTPSATYETVLEMLSVQRLHRVYVTDTTKAGAFVGLITLTDVLRPLNPPDCIELPSEGPAGGLPAGEELQAQAIAA